MTGKVAIFLHHPKCSVQSANGIIKALSPKYTFKIFTKHEIEDSFFKDVDVVAFPGGIGDSDTYSYLLKENNKPIQNFIDRGGRYLGICMGAYWADQDYFDILHGIRVVQYIKSPRSDIKRSYSKAADVKWYGEKEKMYFYDGCTYTGGGKYTTIAKYKNGDPMAIMQNRIGVIGCHPESDKSWYDRKYLKPHWHKYRHHNLLLNFVDELMER